MVIAARRFQRRALLASAGALLAAPAIVRAQAAGVALVIGNSKYRWEASLPNVKRDAPDVARAFQALGLKTELLQDAGRDATSAAVEKFKEAARGANLAAFYFAGHGAAWDKDTFLVPVDADLGTPETVRTLLPVKAISAAMKDAAHRLLVFDNCRNNPADGWRQKEAVISSSVAKAEQAAAALHGPNTLVLFSTAPGRIAVDGPAGENSPFAAMLLRQLARQAIDLHTLSAKLRRDLLIATEGRQVLWDQSTYDQPFVLNGPSGRGSAGQRSSVDPSQIIELNNAYAFAREKGLLLPPGLISFRLPSGSPHGQKIGSFKTTTKVNLGQIFTYTSSIEPLLLIVISVSDSGTAEIVFSTKDWWSSTLGGAGGNIWRYSTATVSGAKLTFGFGRTSQTEGSEEFKWRDANSGEHGGQPQTGVFPYYSPFTRLDG